MGKTETFQSCSSTEVEEPRDEYDELLKTLPKVKNYDGLYVYHYKGFWYPQRALRGIISFQKCFQAHDTDFLLATFPKSGTTWLKALTFSIVNRTHYPLSRSPLLTTNPHALIPFPEFDLYVQDETPNLEDLPCPRIFSTHTPYKALPDSIVDSNCKIVYICRNPLDQFVSHWHFLFKIRRENEFISLDEALELYCKGIHRFGPFWEHVLAYWTASLEKPWKVLFLKYEDLKDDITSHVKRLAEFLGFPFSMEEEEQGLIEEISRLCSFENLKELEANKSGQLSNGVGHSSFFRKGRVGDWANYMTPEMAERLKNVIEEKLAGSGLTFKAHYKPSYEE